MTYKLEGRLNNGWILISQGDLPWKNLSSFPRNDFLGVDISSTYTSGDNSLKYTEVSFHNHDYDYCGSPPLKSNYRGTINSTISGQPCQSWPSETHVDYPISGLGNHNYCRNPNNQPGGAWCYTTNVDIPWEYCEVPDCRNDPGTLNQYVEYKITWIATRNPTQVSLQLAEIEVPGLLGEERAHTPLEYEGEYVSSVLHGGSQITLVNGYSNGADWDQLSIDRSTQKFEMYRDTLNVTPGSCLLLDYLSSFVFIPYSHYRCPTILSGIIVSPSHGQMSVVTSLRLYTANNHPGADPVRYRISGRLMSGANVKNSVNGLCWSVGGTASYGYGNALMGNTNCSSSDSRQKFYMNALGEIRVKSLPGYCLDHRYGFYPEYYISSWMIPCFSEDPYYQDPSYQYLLGKCDLCAFFDLSF